MGSPSARLSRRAWNQWGGSRPVRAPRNQWRPKGERDRLDTEIASVLDWESPDECELDLTASAKNASAIALLESLLTSPDAEDNSFTEQRRKRLDESRLSERKFFT